MASFIDTIRQSNTDKVTELLNESEKMAVSGKREMGKSLVLRVATLAAGFHKVYNLPSGTTIGVPSAVAIAQHHYSRLKGDCMGNISLSETACAELVANLTKFLHPFVYNDIPAVTEKNSTPEEMKAYGSKLMAVTRKAAINAFTLKTGSTEKKKERLDRVTTAIDAIIEKRKNTRTAIMLACLYVYHDQDGKQLSKFDPEKISGLWLPCSAFSHYQSTDDRLIYWGAVDKDDLILVQPVPNAKSNVEFVCPDKTKEGGKRKNILKPASFPLLVTAATRPQENADANGFTGQCKELAKLVRDSVTNQLSADEVLALTELQSAILAREVALKAAQNVADSNQASAVILPVTPIQKRAQVAAKGKPDRDGEAVSNAAIEPLAQVG